MRFFWQVLLLSAYVLQFSKAQDAKNYMPPPSLWKGTDWNKMGKDSIKATLEKLGMMSTRKAKNVVMMMGDGMGVTTASVARLYKREVHNITKLTDMYLEWENFPFSSLVRTYTMDRTTADSAATATAYLSGVKANLGTIGLNEKAFYTKCFRVQGNEVESILHKSLQQGKRTGIVTTTRITHASPAGNYASVPDRSWEAVVPEKHNPKKECSDIAHQLVNDERNKGINVLFGGGAANFLPKTMVDEETGKPGKREDNLNLIAGWSCDEKPEGKRQVVRNKKALDALDAYSTDFVLGLFNESHMSYELDRDVDKEPSLEEMTEKAIDLLDKGDNGFYLFVEGGNIDRGHHENKAKKALSEVLEFEKAVAKVLSMVDLEETMVVVTADHSHVFTMGGYALFQEPVLGFTEKLGVPANDKKPYQQLFYANGPGQLKHRITMKTSTTFDEHPRIDLTGSKEIFGDDYQQDSGVFTMDEGHGAEDVGVHAIGPWSHLFQATEEQTYIAHVMMYASCVGDYQREAHCAQGN